MDDESAAELLRYIKPHVAAAHGIPERYAHRLVGSTLSELHGDARKLAREVGAHDPTQRQRDEGGRYAGTAAVGFNEAVRKAAGR
jgi:hypothetical protein